MALRFLNKIFSEKKKKAVKKTAEAEAQTADEPKKKPAAPEERGAARAERGPLILGILQRPHITEKSSQAARGNKYVFLVGKVANKVLVKKAVEGKYSVGVSAVNILNMPGKERKRGKQVGWKPGYKKAIVTLKEGQSIEIQ